MNATTPEFYTPPRRLPSGMRKTCRGVVIGGAIAPPVPTMTQDGERIQAALLDPRTAQPRRVSLPIAAVLWFAIAGACAAALWLQLNY